MNDGDAEAGHSPASRAASLDRRTELLAVSVLSAAALASSYAGFQAELWDGEQAAHYTLAQQARTDAGKAATVAVQLESVDAMLFAQWLNAYVLEERELEAFYRMRFRPEFRGPFQRWLVTRPKLNPQAPPSPFALPDYDRASLAEGDALNRKAEEQFSAGERANDVSDSYGQASLVLALSLFLGGIVQAFNTHKLRIALIAVAALSCLIGVARLLTLPAIRLI